MANEKRLIDANALIERCKEIAGYEWNHKASPVSWADAYKQFADDVDAEPTVDAVEVVHGRWIGQRCSVCNESYMDYADADSYPAIGEPKPNYCPNCGAKMDGDGDE